MIYEIVNPSDPYTIECPDLEIATVACLMLGRGQYAFESDDPDVLDVPIMMFGGIDEWAEAHFKAKMADVFTRVQTDRAEDLATALDSVLIGSERERQLFDIAKQFFTAEETQQARARWHETRRTSKNDIGARAYAMARKLRGEGVPVDQSIVAPQQIFTS